jgi:hypothetical protein
MTWYAIYEIDSKRLESVGTVVADPLRKGLTAIELTRRPDWDSEQWDQKTLQFVPIPSLVKADRVDDLLKDSRIVLLSARTRDAVRQAAIQVWNDERYYFI